MQIQGGTSSLLRFLSFLNFSLPFLQKINISLLPLFANLWGMGRGEERDISHNIEEKHYQTQKIVLQIAYEN